MNAQTRTYVTGTDRFMPNEGAIANIEQILLDRSEKETCKTEKYKSNYSFSKKTDFRGRYNSRTTDITTMAVEQEILEDWVIDLHKISRPLDDFFSRQKFEGVVTGINEESFVARLQNLTETSPDEEAEFSVNELSKDDFDLLKVGAVFYWNIGYLVQVAGQRIGCHMINFRRLPALSSHEILSADEKAEELLAWLKTNND